MPDRGDRPGRRWTSGRRPAKSPSPAPTARAPRPGAATPASGGWLVLEDVSELRRLQQIRTEFIDNLSHELRTPLTTVSLLAETLTREAEAAGDAIPARMRDRIGKIEVETGHLVQMVNELLDLSRIESGGALGVARRRRPRPRSRPTSIERLRLFAERQGVTPARRRRRPACRRSAATRSGSARSSSTSLHNAVKFSPDGGDVTVRVAVRRRRGRRRRRGPRGRHPAGRPGADLRALLQGRPGAGPRRRRDGPRAGDRPARRRAARRPDLGRVRGGPRLDVLVRAPDRADEPAPTSTDRRLPGHAEPETTDRWTASTSPPSTSATSPTAGPSGCRLLLADMAALQPDLLGLQEVVYVMQQDRLIGAAGEGRYGASVAGPAGPSTATACSSKAPLVGDAITSGSISARPVGPSRPSWRCPAARRVVMAVTHLHHPPDAARGPRRAGRGAPRWLDGAPARGRDDRRRATSTPIRDEPAYARMRGAGFRSAYAGGQRRGARRHLAVGPPGARRWTPTATPTASTTSGSAARSGSVDCAARLRPARSPSDPTLYPSDHLGLGAHTRDRVRPAAASVRRTLRLAHRGDWRHARRTRSRRCSPRWTCRPATASSSTSGSRRDGVPVILHDATLDRVQGVPSRGRRA